LAIFFNKYCAQPLLGSENLRPIMESFSNSCKTDLSKEKRGHYTKSVEKLWFIDKKEVASQHSSQADDPKT